MPAIGNNSLLLYALVFSVVAGKKTSSSGLSDNHLGRFAARGKRETALHFVEALLLWDDAMGNNSNNSQDGQFTHLDIFEQMMSAVMLFHNLSGRFSK